MMKKRQIYAIHCAVILMVLISCSTAKSQWYAGASARMLTDAKSFGGSFEIGKEYSFGWLFIQGAYINRLLNYDQTFFGFIGSSQVPFGYGIGPGDVSFPKSTVVGGVTYAQGTYEAKTYSAYIPRGPQYVISTSYCYILSHSIMLGPTIGFAVQNQSPVAATNDIEGTPSAPLYGPLISAGSIPENYPPESYTSAGKIIIVGNFGGCVKISLSGRDRPALLILDYATQTGAGAGLAFPL